MTALSDLKVFATHPHPCSYLQKELATTLFIDPETVIDDSTYSQLAEAGFRRSGPHIYRPHCKACNACISVRVCVNDFKPNRSQRRIMQRNQDLQVIQLDDIHDDRFYSLYERYICGRHADGDMYPPSREQFDSFLGKEMNLTRYYAFWDNDQLVAVAVTDVMDNGLSAMYTFFDPDQQKRSLGRYAIIWQIEETRRLQLEHLYLGYWVKDCRKMNYKIDYRPLQLYIKNQWLTVT